MIQDYMYMVVSMFMIAVIILVAFVCFAYLRDGFADADIAQVHKDFLTDQVEDFHNGWDYGFLTFYVVFTIGLMITSYALRTVPVFFVILFFVIIILGGVAGYLANAFYEFTSVAPLSLAAANFPIMNYIMTHYLVFVILTGFLMLVSFFAKPEGSPYE